MLKSNLMHTYNRFDVIFEKGSGCKLYDVNNVEYIDFVSGVAVNALGHSNPVIVNALKTQSEKLMHVSNYYYNTENIKLAELLCKNSDHDAVFFCNSGAEAIEGGLKIARKHGKKFSEDKNVILYMTNSFHGRTLGALTVTGQPKYQAPFAPLMTGTQEVEFNNIQDLEEKFSDKVCGVILEPIQGEGGINSATFEFLSKVRELCDKHNAILIFDEVQCGIGRLGTLFAYQKFNVVPDVICLAKALGGGFPIGAIVTKDEASDTLKPGDHGNTYGGNSLACSVGFAVVNELLTSGIIASIPEKEIYIKEKLNALKEKHPVITKVKGMGLLVGIEVSCPPADIMKKAFENKLLIISAGSNVIRFLPPLNVKYEEIDEALNVLDKVLYEVENA